MKEKEIKKYNLLYHTDYEVEVVAASLEEAQKIAAEKIEEWSKYECSQDLWNSLKYKKTRKISMIFLVLHSFICNSTEN